MNYMLEIAKQFKVDWEPDEAVVEDLLAPIPAPTGTTVTTAAVSGPEFAALYASVRLAVSQYLWLSVCCLMTMLVCVCFVFCRLLLREKRRPRCRALHRGCQTRSVKRRCFRRGAVWQATRTLHCIIIRHRPHKHQSPLLRRLTPARRFHLRCLLQTTHGVPSLLLCPVRREQRRAATGSRTLTSSQRASTGCASARTATTRTTRRLHFSAVLGKC